MSKRELLKEESALKRLDPQIYSAIESERNRQRNHLELIASENFCSMAVLEAQGSVLTNKYAEGYPGKRYYGGCVYVDEVEAVAIERAKRLFGAEHANVQPHSGSQANMEVYFTILSTGERMIAMSLEAGGHLTHGFNINFSGYLFDVVHYGLEEKSERLDYKEAARLAREMKPKLIVAGASAYPRTIDFEFFANLAKEVGAYFLVDMAHIAGLVATGLHPDPVPLADFVTSTTHKTLRGPRGGLIVCKEEYARKLDLMVFPGVQGGPLMHVIAGKAVSFLEALQPEFREYQKQVLANAKALAEELLARKYHLITGGTDNHLILVDLAKVGLSGREAETILEEAGITVNKNLIPKDPRSSLHASGIRLGTPALTTRGMKERDLVAIAGWIDEVLTYPASESVLKRIREKVADLAAQFPLYPELDALT